MDVTRLWLRWMEMLFALSYTLIEDPLYNDTFFKYRQSSVVVYSAWKKLTSTSVESNLDYPCHCSEPYHNRIMYRNKRRRICWWKCHPEFVERDAIAFWVSVACAKVPAQQCRNHHWCNILPSRCQSRWTTHRDHPLAYWKIETLLWVQKLKPCACLALPLNELLFQQPCSATSEW